MLVAQGSLILTTASIGISTTTTGPISTNGLSLCGIQLPASFTGTSISFLAATTLGGTYQPIYNKSGQVTYTVAGGQYIAIAPLDFYGVLFLEIVSNASEAADRSLICSLKGI